MGWIYLLRFLPLHSILPLNTRKIWNSNTGKNWAAHWQSRLSSWHTGHSTGSTTTQPKRMHLGFESNFFLTSAAAAFSSSSRILKSNKKKKRKNTDTWIISEQTWWSGGGKTYLCKNAHLRTKNKTQDIYIHGHIKYPTKHEYRTYLHVYNILDIGHLMPKVLSHIYMPHKMTWCQQFSDLSVCLQSCETTSNTHIQPTWAQYISFSLLLHPILCLETFAPASYDKFCWKVFKAWLSPYTSYSARCQGALLMTAVCKYQYDANNLVTVQ